MSYNSSGRSSERKAKTEATTVITAIIAGLSTGGVLSAVVFYVLKDLKNKMSRNEAKKCQERFTEILDNRHEDANAARQRIQDTVQNNRDKSDADHEDNRKAVMVNKQVIERHWKENADQHRIIRKGLVGVMIKIHDLPSNGEGPQELIKKLNGD